MESGVLWFGNDDANMIAYTPIYCGNTIQPECYNTPGADDVTFSDKNAFWVCNWVSNMVYPRYSMLFPTLKQVRDSLENSYFKDQKQVEANALQLYKKSSEEAVKYLNSYSNDKAQSMLSDWKKMAYYMIVKYNDMVVKPEENGAFKMTKEGIAAPTIRPGFSKSYFREVIKQTGDKFAVPEVKK